MKNTFYLLLIAFIALTSCQDDDSTIATLELTGKALEYQTNKGLNNVLISSKIGESSDISDSLGNYIISLDQNKSYDFIASISGYYTTNIKIDAEKIDIENQIIWMSKIVQNKSTVRGFVRDEGTGEALTNVKIFTLPATDAVFSNAYGYYELLLSDGTYTINSEYETYVAYLDTIEISSPAIIDENILLHKAQTYSITGKVTYEKDNSPAQNVEITTIPQTKTVLTDENGSYNLAIKEGMYEVHAKLKGHTSNKFHSIYLQNDTDNIDFALTEIDTSIFVKNQIVYYSFDENNADDETENGLNGIINNEHSFVKGKFGNAIRVVGVGIDTPDGGHILLPNIDFNNYSEFTINFWINEEGFSHQSGQSFFSTGNTTFGAMNISHMYKYNKDGGSNSRFLHFCVGATAKYGEPSPLYVDEEVLKMHDWNMLTLVYKNGTMKAYVNSEIVGTLNQEVNIFETNIAIARHWHDKSGTTVTSTKYIGSIDEFRIFDIELSVDKIQNLYNINKVK